MTASLTTDNSTHEGGGVEHYPDHYPTLHELLRYGGEPGVEYCQVYGGNTGTFQAVGWRYTQNMPGFSVGKCNAVVLLSRGEPIPGASPHNGKRKCFVDDDLPKLTGIPLPDPPAIVPNGVTDEEVARARSENGPGAGKSRGAKATTV